MNLFKKLFDFGTRGANASIPIPFLTPKVMTLSKNSIMGGIVTNMGFQLVHAHDACDAVELFGLKMRKTFGAFDHRKPNQIIMFNECGEERLEYVIAHELGHLLNCKEENEHFKMLKSGEAIAIMLTDMRRWHLISLIEEFRADTFAWLVMQELNLGESEFLNKRISQLGPILGNELMIKEFDESYRVFEKYKMQILTANITAKHKRGG